MPLELPPALRRVVTTGWCGVMPGRLEPLRGAYPVEPADRALCAEAAESACACEPVRAHCAVEALGRAGAP